LVLRVVTVNQLVCQDNPGLDGGLSHFLGLQGMLSPDSKVVVDDLDVLMDVYNIDPTPDVLERILLRASAAFRTSSIPSPDPATLPFPLWNFFGAF
jgi:hypothetical protein